MAAPTAPPRSIGSGPYRVAEVVAGRMVLEAVAGHWSGGARAERLVFVEVASDEHAEAELDARALDVWFPPFPPRRDARARSRSPGCASAILAFQTEKEPFSRKKVRQAVAAALDPPVIGVALGSRRRAAPLVLARRASGRAAKARRCSGARRQTVTALLTEGGWPQGQATLVAPGEPAGVNLPKLAETLRLMLRASDIGIQLRVETADAARAIAQSGDHDLVLGEAVVTGGDPHFLLYPLSTSEGAEKGPRAANSPSTGTPASTTC